jgi:hypothetical protein
MESDTKDRPTDSEDNWTSVWAATHAHVMRCFRGMNEKRAGEREALRQLSADAIREATQRARFESGEAVAAQSTERDRPLTRHTLAGTPGGRK